MIFEAPARPSPLALRECTRPRFDGNLERLNDWLIGLRSAGVRQAGPALIMALESLRKGNFSANRRLSVLSSLKLPVLKTCAGLPKPSSPEEEPLELEIINGVTVEQRIYRLMFANLNLALRQLDQQHYALTPRQQRKRAWAIRNLYRFGARQVRYAAHWNSPLPAGTWRDLHELHLYLSTRCTRAPWSDRSLDAAPASADQDQEYKQLLLFGLAAQISGSLVRSEFFLDELDGWAVQTQLEDPLRMLGRLRLFLVEIAEDAPPRQLQGALETPFHGWVLRTPYSFIHELEDAAGHPSPYYGQSSELTLCAHPAPAWIGQRPR